MERHLFAFLGITAISLVAGFIAANAAGHSIHDLIPSREPVLAESGTMATGTLPEDFAESGFTAIPASTETGAVATSSGSLTETGVSADVTASGSSAPTEVASGSSAETTTPPTLSVEEKAKLVDLYRTAVREAMARGDAAASLDAMERLVDLDPYDVATLRKGVFFAIVGIGDSTRARAFAVKLVSANPDDAEAQNAYCWALLETRDLAPAWDACERALQIQPTLAAAELNLGDIALAREQPSEARIHWQKVIELEGEGGAFGKIAAQRLAANPPTK